MSKTALWALLIAVLIPVGSYFVVKHYSDDSFSMPQRYFADSVINRVVDGKETTDTIWHKVANVTLINQLGDTVSLDDLHSKVIVANFFFTHGPATSTTLTRNMKRLQDALKLQDESRRIDTTFVQFLSFTVDPDRDSADVLKAYADKHNVNPGVWWMLTGPKETIYDFALNELKVPAEDGGKIDSNFIHSSRFVLMDKDRVVRGYYDGLNDESVNKLASDIVFIMLEKDKKKKRNLFRK